MKTNLWERKALITGAAGGIGRAIAVSLAKRGCHLILTDVNEEGLLESKAIAETHGVKVQTHLLDVGSGEAIKEFADKIAAAEEKLDLLVNNAGVALGGKFEQVSEQDFEWLFAINFWGVVRMTRAFLPLLHKSDDARIVNLSSIFGIVAPPNQTAYSASKFAVRGFSQALMRELEKSTIGVTVVHPGGVATSIAKNARRPVDVTEEEIEKTQKRYEKTLKLPPERAGEIIVKGIEKKKPRVIVGSDAVIVSWLERLFPIAHWSILRSQAPK